MVKNLQSKECSISIIICFNVQGTARPNPSPSNTACSSGKPNFFTTPSNNSSNFFVASPYGYPGWLEMQLVYEHQLWPKAMIKEKM
jgi:hypothetical protein